MEEAKAKPSPEFFAKAMEMSFRAKMDLANAQRTYQESKLEAERALRKMDSLQ